VLAGVGHHLAIGMVAVRYRNEPDRTYLYPKDRVPSQEEGRAAR
jgi:hypothetical protein